MVRYVIITRQQLFILVRRISYWWQRELFIIEEAAWLLRKVEGGSYIQLL